MSEANKSKFNILHIGVLLLGISALIAAISICYYYVIAKPNIETKKNEQAQNERMEEVLTDKKQECEKLARAEQERQEDDAAQFDNRYAVDPQFGYNEEYASCYYSGGHTDFRGSESFSIYELKDLTTNKTVEVYLSGGDMKVEDYFTQVKKYIGE